MFHYRRGKRFATYTRIYLCSLHTSARDNIVRYLPSRHLVIYATFNTVPYINTLIFNLQLNSALHSSKFN